METLFGRAVEVPADFDNESVYVFYLRDGGKPAAAAAAAPPAMQHLRMGAGGAPGAAGGRFQANVVVTRHATDKPLAAFVADMRKQVAADAPNLKLVQEGAMTVARSPGHQVEYAASATEPAMQLVQWHVTTIRDGYAYTFFCSSERGRFAADKPRFEAFMAGWK